MTINMAKEHNFSLRGKKENKASRLHTFKNGNTKGNTFKEIDKTKRLYTSANILLIKDLLEIT